MATENRRRVLVTGATGRVGGAVLSQLRGKLPVLAATQSARPPEPGVEWVRFDLEDPTTFAAALIDVGSIFLMRPPQIARREPFVPFFEAASARGIRKLVFLSVLGAESNRLLPHHGIEQLIMSTSLDWTMVRPSDFMQNLETVHLESIRDRNEIAVPAGLGRSSFIDVADIGEIVAKILQEDGHARRGYTLTGPDAPSFDDVTRELTAVLGRPIRYRRIGALRFLAEQRGKGQPLGLSLVMTALYTVQRLGMAAKITDEADRLLGRPPHNLSDYLSTAKAMWMTGAKG